MFAAGIHLLSTKFQAIVLCLSPRVTVGFHEFGTPTNSQNLLSSHELKDRPKGVTCAIKKDDLKDN
jgi:hypothetical protein